MDHLQQAILLVMVPPPLRTRKNRIVVGHHSGAAPFGTEHCAVDSAHARHHAIGWCIALEIVEAAAALLGRDCETTVLRERARIAQVGDVLARRSPALGMPLRDSLRTGLIQRQGDAIQRARKVGPDEIWIGFRSRNALRLCVIGRHEPQQHLPLVNEITGFRAARRDAARLRQHDAMLHLHGLEDQHLRARGECGAFIYIGCKTHETSGHRRTQRG